MTVGVAPAARRAPTSRARLLGYLWLLLVFPAAAQEDPRAWLERMAYALENLNYEGTLVQFHGTEAAVMRVVHRVTEDGSAERITALDEVGREIIRRGEEVTCILPDQRTVLVEQRADRPDATSPLRQQFAGDLSFPPAYYHLAMAGDGRLLGREIRIVAVRPMDGWRYGYRLWLDRATAMPLKVQLVDDQERVIEQILFSGISLPAEIAAAAVSPSRSTEGFTWHRSSAPGTESGRPAGGGRPVWLAERLPPGFELRAQRIKQVAGSGAVIEQLVYSDGVARVSVFIETLAEGSADSEGASRMGAANAYTTLSGARMVTAVGEVPVPTVTTIAQSLRPVAP